MIDASTAERDLYRWNHSGAATVCRQFVSAFPRIDVVSEVAFIVNLISRMARADGGHAHPGTV